MFVPVSWGKREEEYFLRDDWTVYVALKFLGKLDF